MVISFRNEKYFCKNCCHDYPVPNESFLHLLIFCKTRIDNGEDQGKGVETLRRQSVCGGDMVSS